MQGQQWCLQGRQGAPALLSGGRTPVRVAALRSGTRLRVRCEASTAARAPAVPAPASKNGVAKDAKEVLGAPLGAAYERSMPDWHKGRRAGVILHPTSLPGPYGIGELGSQCFAYIDWLSSAGMQLWQVRGLTCRRQACMPVRGEGAEDCCLFSSQLAGQALSRLLPWCPTQPPCTGLILIPPSTTGAAAGAARPQVLLPLQRPGCKLRQPTAYQHRCAAQRGPARARQQAGPNARG